MYIVLYNIMGVISVHTLHQGSVLLMCYHVMMKATYDVHFMAKPGHFMFPCCGHAPGHGQAQGCAQAQECCQFPGHGQALSCV